MADIADQLMFAALGFAWNAANMVKDTDIGVARAVEKFLNHHVAYHGTATENVRKIMLHGFKESPHGMLGQGVYAAHDLNKAKWFANNRGKGNGTVLKVEFDSANISLTDMNGAWRESADAVYSAAAKRSKRSEMCIKGKLVKVSEATGSMSEQARAKIDEFFIRNPALKKSTVFLSITAEVAMKAYDGASLGARCAGNLLDAMASGSQKMSPPEFERLVNEGTAFGTAVGISAGMGAVGLASMATTTVPAAGIWGALGCTTTVASFGAGALAGIGGAVAFPVAAVAAAAYVLRQ